MPRPGPRPYECVRRAWHSDWHQPMRGSIIQQIFRVVNAAHGPATRKNREWQKQLPIVVLKAEEIMYSKANSEADYTNPDTLWDRLSDAIDTIIRRDEGTETGQFLQPCIEAALVLGCIPVRGSRSQRHYNPWSYLSSRALEPPPMAPAASNVLDKINIERPTFRPSNPFGSQSGIPKPKMANQANSASKSDSLMNHSTIPMATNNVSILHPNLLHSFITSCPLESNIAMKFGSVYPLYYGTHFRNVEPRFGLNNVIVGTPIGWSPTDPAFCGATMDLFHSERIGNAADKLSQENSRESHEKASETDCDLSLRLGTISNSKSLVREIRDGGSSSCQEGSKFSEWSSRNREFCFFPSVNTNDSSEPCPSKQVAAGKVQNLATTLGKRKALLHDDEGGDVHWKQEPLSNQFPSRIIWPGL
ncbi:hypothetical protein Nepgr_006379 [Nepenthes gracilis]|uniref:Uncharacterized protein n=1 Tax=Nepenthes gracilis TaxID=150966 RepID=A0AAD3S584_NEPGR|nr:hypothetical protein Nepgr_006379 [Nepenthes gracilis]